MKEQFIRMSLFFLVFLVSCSSLNSVGAIKETVSLTEKESDGELVSTPTVELQDITDEEIKQKEKLTLISQTGITYQTITIRDNYAFVGAGNCLLALDISTPLEPTMVGSLCGFPSVIKRIALTQDFAYIVDGDSLHVINISDPHRLVEVGFLDTEGTAESISISGNYGYLADGIEGLRIIDVSIPEEPREVNCIHNIHAIDVMVHGNYVYTVDDGEVYLRVFNISDPTNTLEVASFETTASESANLIQYRTPDFRIAISGKYAYVVDGLDDLHIFDISDLGNIRQLRILNEEDNIVSVAAAGNFVCIVTEGNKIIVTENKLQILDVTDPKKPQRLGSIESLDIPKGLVIGNDYMFMLGQGNGMTVVDISEPEIPRVVAYYDEFPDEFGIGAQKVFDVAVNGKYLYIPDENCLFIMEIMDPENSKKIGSINLPGNARTIQVQGSYAYVMTAEARFIVIDISNPGEPNIVGTTNVHFFPYPSEFDVKDRYAYASGQISEGEYELDIIDISNSAKPEIVYSYSYNVADSGFRGISVNNEYVYIIGYHCFLILDISDPLTPIEIFSDRTISGSDIDVVDNYAYLVTSEGLSIYDVTDPQNPEFVILKGYDGLSTINISGKYAYSSFGGEGLKVIDITEPTNPSEVAFCDTLKHTLNVIGFGEYIYVASLQDGLLTFRFSSE